MRRRRLLVSFVCVLIAGVAWGVWVFHTSPRLTLDVDMYLSTVMFSQTGQLIVAGEYVQVWDATSYKRLYSLTDAIGPIAYNPTNGYLATGQRMQGDVPQEDIMIWDIKTGELVAQLGGHSDGISGFAFSADGVWLASSSYDLTIRLWRMSDMREVHRIKQDIRRLQVFAFSPDSQTIASSGENGTIKLWRVSDGSLLQTFESNFVYSLAFSPDGRTFATSGQWYEITLRDNRDGHVIGWLSGHTDHINSIAYSSDGAYLASGSGSTEALGHGSDSSVRIWRVRDRQLLKIYEPPLSFINKTIVRDLFYRSVVESVAFSPDDAQVAAGYPRGIIRIWDVP